MTGRRVAVLSSFAGPSCSEAPYHPEAVAYYLSGSTENEDAKRAVLETIEELVKEGLLSLFEGTDLYVITQKGRDELKSLVT